MMWELVKFKLLMAAVYAAGAYFSYHYIVAEVIATISGLGAQIK